MVLDPIGRKDAASINRAFSTELAESTRNRTVLSLPSSIWTGRSSTLRAAPKGKPCACDLSRYDRRIPDFLVYEGMAESTRRQGEAWAKKHHWARDSYDDCLGYIDGQLGLLFDELEHRSRLCSIRR